MMNHIETIKKNEVSTGTTIMAITFQDGVIIAADSRTSSGVYVVNRVTDKLTKLTDKIYCLRSGSAADTQFLAELVTFYINYYNNEENNDQKDPLVSDAAHVFRKYCYMYKNYLSASIIVAGYDEKDGGSIYAIPIGGTILKREYAVGGSGSTYIMGYVEENFAPGMNKDEGVQFVKKCIQLAMSMDGSSGGVVRVAVITKDGVERRTFTEDRNFE